MDIDGALALADRIHDGQLTRFGEPLIDHIGRVANSVPADSVALAYLHEVLEKGGGAAEELRERDLTDFEYAVLELLTHDPGESYRKYVTRIARAEGEEGRVARAIKLADIDDHLRFGRSAFGSPNYQWARVQIIEAQRSNHEIPASHGARLGRVA